MEVIHLFRDFAFQHETRHGFVTVVIQTRDCRRPFSGCDAYGLVQQILRNIVHDHDILGGRNVSVNTSFQEIYQVLVLGVLIRNQNRLRELSLTIMLDDKNA